MAIKIEFDGAYNAIEPTLVLATRSGQKLGSIPANDVVLKESLNSAAEMSFSVNKSETDLWDDILDFKLIWAREWDLWFEIYVEITEQNSTVKNITATSLGEAELSQVYLYDIEINTEDDIARDEYVEPTVLYNPDEPEASLLHRITEKIPHYDIVYVDSTIANIQRTFSFDGVSIYDAFQEIAEEIGCLFIINSNSISGKPARTISIYDLESNCASCGYRGEFTATCPECGSTLINEGYGNDTTIFVSSECLGDNIQFTTDTDSVKNCFRLEAGDDLMTATVVNCNPNGSAYIWYITDDMKKDMSANLVSKLDSYDSLYDYYQNRYAATIPSDILEQYNNLIEKYQSYDSDLETLTDPIIGYTALMNAYYDTIDFELYLQSELMPSVSLSDTSASAEAEALVNSGFSSVAVANINSVSLATANSAVLAMAKVVVDSRYQVKVNDSSMSDLIWTGSFVITNYSDDTDTITTDNISVTITGDEETYYSQLLDKELNGADTDDLDITGLFQKDYDEFCEALKKYGLNSLTTFHEACQACLNVMINLADKQTWSGEDPNLYDDLYIPFYDKLGAIENEMLVRENEIKIVAGEYDVNGGILTYGVQTYIEDIRANIQEALDFEAYLGSDLWLEFCAFRREDTYSNSNYISDGLNNAELFSNAREFISVAEKEIYKSAELQHSISATLKNLLVIEEFEPLLDYFELGNWIHVQVVDDIYKLRLIGYEINFSNLETLSVEFSDITKVVNGMSDMQSVLNQAASMATSYNATQHQASQGSSSSKVVESWRENGLDITNTKIIAGAENQTQTWDSNGMLFREYDPVTDSYKPTQSKIVNSTYAITDDNWRTIKTAIGNFYYIDPITGDLISAYGVNGEVIVGNLILGESLGIYTSDGLMTFDENGLVIDTSGGIAFTIKNGDNVQFYIDADGNVVLDNGASITWGNIDLTDLILSSGNIVVYDEDGQTVYDEDGNPIDIFTYAANYINTKYLTAEYITSNCIDTQYLNAEEIDAYLADIVNLNTSNLYAAIADIVTLNVEDLTAEYITATDISSVSIETETLTTTLANIVSLLAGDAGVGDLQAINLSSDNVVIADATITDAMISSLAADKITSGTIYTSLVTIQTAEDDASLYISGSTLQINDGNYVRVQIGEDGNGDYNLYLWDASGNLLWDALGLTEAGVSGNGGIIKDIAVAEDAAIKGTKLDIESVASCLTEDGSLVVDASKVTINDSTLAAEYKTITQSLADIESDAVSNVTTYYALGSSGTEPPSDPSIEDEYYSTNVGSAIVGLSTIGTTGWTTERLVASEENFLWVAYYIEYVDGSDSWTTPTCITDDYIRSTTSTLITSFEVINGQISSKVWQSDIEEATNSLNEQVTTLTDNYSEIIQTQEDISATVAELVTTSDSHESRISSLEITADGITTTVSEAITEALDGYATQEWTSSQISQTADDVLLSVENTYSSSIMSQVAYFALGSSSENPPSDPSTDDSIVAGIVGTAVVGNSAVGTIGWTTEQPDPVDGSYIWVAYLLTSVDGTTSWTTPVCITDDYTRTTVADMGAALETTVSTTAELQITTDSIASTVSSNYTTLDSKISTVSASLVLEIKEDEDGTRYGAISANADYIYLGAGELVIYSDNFTLDADGNLTINGYAATDDLEAVQDKVDNISIGGRNLLVQSTMTDGYRIDQNGADYASTYSSLTDYLEISDCTEVTYSVQTIYEDEGDCYFQLAFYDSDQTFISRLVHEEAITYSYLTYWTVSVPTNAAYFRVALPTSIKNKVKLEKGNYPTDWTSAPEDIDSAISDTLDTINTTSEELSSSISEVSSKLAEIDDYKTLSEKYMTFDTQNGLTIGAYIEDSSGNVTESVFTTTINNMQMSFNENGATVAYINGEQLNINRAVINEGLNIGNYYFAPHEDGGDGFSISYKG